MAVDTTRAPSRALLYALRREAGVAAVAASDVADGKPLTGPDAMRVAQAAGRLARMVEMLDRGLSHGNP